MCRHRVVPIQILVVIVLTSFPHRIFAQILLCTLSIIRTKAWLGNAKFICYSESGSTARNASARISTARQFFQKCHLLDRKTSSARQKKVCRTCTTCQFRAVDKKTASARIFEQMTKFL
jgi:hypothetical protein